MNEKVVGLHGIVPTPTEPVESTVRHLEALLEKARNGFVTGVVTVTFDQDKCTFWQSAGFFNNRSVIGALAVAQHALVCEDLK